MLYMPFIGFARTGAFGVFFIFLFFLVSGFIIATLVRSFSGRGAYSSAPVLTVFAAVVAKRQITGDSGYYNYNVPHRHGYPHARYFLTFEVESGDRLEFNVVESEYGMAVEGDYGRLTFKGPRFLGFERERQINAGNGRLQ